MLTRDLFALANFLFIKRQRAERDRLLVRHVAVLCLTEYYIFSFLKVWPSQNSKGTPSVGRKVHGVWKNLRFPTEVTV